MAYVIGLTGGIASGKTTASDYLAGLGFPIIDTDVIAREVVEPGSPGLKKIREVFGGAAISPEGRLDRAYMADLIYKHKPARKILEDITHPLIEREVQGQLASFGPEDKVVLVVPLMFETGFDAYCDEVWLVRVPRGPQVARLMARDQVTEDQALARLNAQMSDRDRAQRSDVVIENTGDLSALYRRIDQVLADKGWGKCV